MGALADALAKYGSQRAAAEALGMARTTFQDRLNAERASPTIGAITEAYRPAAPDISPRETPKYRVIAPPGKFLRVLVLGDTHVHPGIPETWHMSLAGRHAQAEQPDLVVHIGDFLDLHSLCFHTKENTYQGKAKPSFEQDIDAGAEALAAFMAELSGGYSPRRHIVFGNHEARAQRYEDANPAMAGQLTGQLETLFESHGWTWQHFGHWTMAGGVGFTHVPRTIMARPVGGKTVENTLANDATFDIVFGHTHRANDIKRAKHGYNNFVRVVNVGTSMLPGYLPNYAEALPTGYDYGVCELTIFDNHVQSAAFRTWRELEMRHGKVAA